MIGSVQLFRESFILSFILPLFFLFLSCFLFFHLVFLLFFFLASPCFFLLVLSSLSSLAKVRVQLIRWRIVAFIWNQTEWGRVRYCATAEDLSGS